MDSENEGLMPVGDSFEGNCVSENVSFDELFEIPSQSDWVAAMEQEAKADKENVSFDCPCVDPPESDIFKAIEQGAKADKENGSFDDYLFKSLRKAIQQKAKADRDNSELRERVKELEAKLHMAEEENEEYAEINQELQLEIDRVHETLSDAMAELRARMADKGGN